MYNKKDDLSHKYYRKHYSELCPLRRATINSLTSEYECPFVRFAFILTYAFDKILQKIRGLVNK